jgi:hypothetical protein
MAYDDVPGQKRENMSNDRTLSLSTVTATIHAPIEMVNIADWLFHLPDAEYQRCSQAHIAAGTTTSDDGRAMSINVETIGDALVVQHYVAETREPHLCRMVSISDSISPVGRTRLQVIWELGARRSMIRPLNSLTTFIRAPSTKPWPSLRSMKSHLSAPARPGSMHRTHTTRKRHLSLPRVSSEERSVYLKPQP